MLVRRAQQAGMPVIGFLSGASPVAWADQLRGFHRGLKDACFVEGQNVTIEYRWAKGHFERLSALAADLDRRHAAVIVTPFSLNAAGQASVGRSWAVRYCEGG
jgi:putative ABC transport system substrate-binding protein